MDNMWTKVKTSPENRATILSFAEIGLVVWAHISADGQTDGNSFSISPGNAPKEKDINF
jgi:hypothetical protein